MNQVHDAVFSVIRPDWFAHRAVKSFEQVTLKAKKLLIPDSTGAEVDLSTHGASIHTNRTRRFFLTPQQFTIAQGTPALAMVGSSANVYDKIAAWAFDGMGANGCNHRRFRYFAGRGSVVFQRNSNYCQ